VVNGSHACGAGESSSNASGDESTDAVQIANGGGKERKAKRSRYARGGDLFAALSKAQYGAQGNPAGSASAAAGGGGETSGARDDMLELSLPSASSMSTWTSSQESGTDPRDRLARRFGREMPDDDM
jgi:hypothetical protein